MLSELTCADFITYCKTNIIPHLVHLENERVKKLNKAQNYSKICIFFTILMIAGLCIAVILCMISGNDTNNAMGKASIIFSWISYISLFILAITGYARKKLISPMINEFKSSAYSSLFSYFGNFEYYSKELPVDYRVYDSAKIMVKGLQLFDEFNIYKCDDFIKGNYNGLDIKILDLFLQRVTGSGKNRHSETIFDGVLLACDCNKKTHSTTIVRLDSLNKLLPPKGLSRVVLEDPLFEKEFDVYSTDQTESRYILTTAFMNRLLKVQKKLGIPLTCSFENGKMYVALHSIKDWFDVDFEKDSFTDIRTFQKILIDLVEVLSIIDTLNADSNIGM